MVSLPKVLCTFFLCFLFSIPLFGQEENTVLEDINRLIQDDSIQHASTRLNTYIKELKSSNSYTALAACIYPLGKIEIIQNPETALEEASSLYSHILSNTENPTVNYLANIELASLYNDLSKPQEAYNYASNANEQAVVLKDPIKLAESEYYMAEYGMKQGDFNLLFSHIESAIDVMRANPEDKFPIAPRIYNYQGAIKSFSAQPDSANYYFKLALEGIDDMEKTPENQFYLPGTIKGNWFMVKETEGEYSEAMQLSLESMRLFQRFLKETNNHPLTSRVLGNLSIAYRNIGSLYNDMGDKEKAKKFAEIGYAHAKKNFAKNSLQFFNAALMMGEMTIYSDALNESLDYLAEAEKSLQHLEGENYNWYAQLYSVYGDAKSKMGNYKEAVTAYEKSQINYKKSTPEGWSQNQIFLLLNLSQAYSKAGIYEKGLDTAESVYNYTKKQYGENSFLANHALVTMTRISLEHEQYEEALKWSSMSLETYRLQQTDKNIRDQYYFEGNRAEMLLLNTKAKHHLLAHKNETSLNELYQNIQIAIDLLANRKSLITSHENVNNLIADNLEIFKYAKKLNLELFELTGNADYVEKIIQLHESSLYNRIRARLNLNDLKVYDVSESILEREKSLRKELNNLLSEEMSEIDVADFVESINKWDSFLDSLKQKEPKYYAMRYGNIEETIAGYKKNIPANTTLIRYVFITDNLYAYVVTENDKKWVPLDYDREAKNIELLSDSKTDIQDISKASTSLYRQIWHPIQQYITTGKVLIIPDGELFNLSFELLSPQRIKSLADFSEKSILADYVVSYDYSLLLLKHKSKEVDYNEDFVAYAPEFTEKMKHNYEVAITDSIAFDKTYLTLLRQPFSVDLAKSSARRFDGNFFINEDASKQVFINSAKEHTIIHIGTHAESNNKNPELSRLIFAKNPKDANLIENNSLYSYEIYNYNFSSGLALLTACETGRPTYRPGEGMISLAHAFNYAGSESILTSLWNIDEQASAVVISAFYDDLADGLPKDVALRNAKLHYLTSAEGRTLHPQYWAGLILMGDKSPINIAQTASWPYCVLGILIIGLILYFIFRRRTLKNN